MLSDEANMQKQKKREDQLRRWKERESEYEDNSSSISQTNVDESIDTVEKFQKQKQLFQNTKQTKVRFPKSCVFLAACSAGDTDEVKQHLKMGVNINTTNVDGLTALHQACIDANIETVKFLVENEADINSQDNEGWTPLHAAISVGNLDVSRFLVSKGAKLNICNNDGDLPIDLCDSSNIQIKEFLEDEMKRQSIDTEFEKRKEELMMYEDASEMNFSDKIHQKTGATPLHVSAAKGYSRVIRLLIQCGADVNAIDKDGWTPLHAAAHWEQEEACKILVENGANFDIKTYSGQTPFEVCDSEMISKLKALQNNSKQLPQRLVLNNNLKNNLDTRVNDPVSGDIHNKHSFQNSFIETFDKKHEKVLTSPPPMHGSIELQKVNMETEKENDSKSVFNNITNDINQINDENKNGQKEDSKIQFNKEAECTFSNQNAFNINNNLISNEKNTDPNNILNNNNYNNGKVKPSGLHETLKSLSAQVKMKMDEDKDGLGEKNLGNNSKMPDDKLITPNLLASSKNTQLSSSFVNKPVTNIIDNTLVNSNNNSNENSSIKINSDRWGVSSENDPSIYTRKLANNDDGIKSTANIVNITEKSSENSNNISTGATQSNEPILLVKNNLHHIVNLDANRRYSSAPVASKDEQAELIRKQKAKLERHFRRSTQAVSYEDIKSAEAAIKGSSHNSSNSNNVQKNSPNISATTEQASTEQPSTLNVSYPSTTTTNFNFSSTTSPVPQQGVSLLSTLFGESKANKTVSSPGSLSNTSTSNFQLSINNSINSPVLQSPLNQKQPNPFFTNTNGETSIIKNNSSNSPSLNPSSPAVLNNSSNTLLNNNYNNNCSLSSESSIERDNIIANDIETDKLLNVIEKSKGFSDSFSTTAARRLRNRAYPFNSASYNNNAFINKNMNNGVLNNNSESSLNNGKKISKLKWNEEKLEVEYDAAADKNKDLEMYLKKNGTNGESIGILDDINDVGENCSGESNGIMHSNTANSSQTNSCSASGSLISLVNSSNLRSGIKRSVSQVPSTNDRKALDQQPVTKNFTTNTPDIVHELESKKDYQTAYEIVKKENDNLNLTIQKLQKDLEEQIKKNENGVLDKREKRAIDRRISELEEEVKKVDNLKQDNTRLKEENAALIRVISKLSK